MKALSVRQPWAWLLFHGKTIENRDWPTNYRGPLAIHASAAMTKREWQEARLFVRAFDFDLSNEIPQKALLTFGAVIGTVDLVDCVKRSESDWFVGNFGFVFEHAELLSTPVPAKGVLGFWEWNEKSTDSGVSAIQGAV